MAEKKSQNNLHGFLKKEFTWIHAYISELYVYWFNKVLDSKEAALHQSAEKRKYLIVIKKNV